MKKLQLLIFMLAIAGVSRGQINFDAYGKITNPQFADFVALFEQKDLPISTNSILSEFNLRNMPIATVSDEMVNMFLRKADSTLITGVLYSEKLEDGLPDNLVEGKFYPLYRLPTNGDYVLLVYAQIDPAFEGYDKILVVSFDLEGNYLYLTNYLYRAGDINTNNSIDEDLQSVRRYVIYEENGQMVFPPTEGQFTALEGHSIYQINSNGKSTKLFFEEVSGLFEFNKQSYKFDRIN